MPMTATRTQNILRRYAIALVLSLAAAGVQASMGWVLGETRLLFAVPAVVVAAWFGGIGPGVLAAIVPFAVHAWLVGPWRVINATRPADVGGVGLFVFTTLLICLTMRQLRRHSRDERRQRVDVERRL